MKSIRLTISIFLLTGILIAISVFMSPNTPSDVTNTNSSIPEDASIFDKLTDPAVLKAKSKTAEKMRLANWKKNFPWKPTNDPDVKFDPYKHLCGYFHIEVAPNTYQDSYRTRAERVSGGNHARLVRFYNDEMRFTSQFEQFYRILNEHGRGHNPAEAASVFYALRTYYHTVFEHEPNEKNEWDYSQGPKSSLHFDTWGGQAERELDVLRGKLMTWAWLDQRFSTELGKIELMGLINRLVTEIDGLVALPLDVMAYAESDSMSDGYPEAKALHSGEAELLVPYVGWNQAADKYQEVQEHPIISIYQQLRSLVKAVTNELHPPVNIKNGQIVNQDGDPVTWQKDLDFGLISEPGEKIH